MYTLSTPSLAGPLVGISVLSVFRSPDSIQSRSPSRVVSPYVGVFFCFVFHQFKFNTYSFVVVVVMDDYASSDDDYRYSDQEDSVDDAFENDDHDYQLLGSKGPTTQVFSSFPFDFYSFTAVPNFIFFLFV